MEIDLQQLPIPDWGLHCPKCRYPLRGLPSHRCPECGTALDVPSLVRPWTPLRAPRFTGQERPLPDFGLSCAKCGAPLTGAREGVCPRCNEPFHLNVFEPDEEWFAVDPWMSAGLSLPVLETALVLEHVPHVLRDDKAVMDFYFGPRSTTARLFLPRAFFFELLWLARETRREILAARVRSGGRDWRCPHCGEDVPGHFDFCWSCEKPRNAEG